MKLPRVLAICPAPSDATAFYRAVWPLARLEREGRITFQVVTDDHWIEFAKADIIFLQRPHLPKYVKMAQEAKLWGKTLWVDYDDLLFKVPETNPAHKIYSNESVQGSMKVCLELADIVTVSTEPLREALSVYNKNVVVLPNAIDLDLLNYRNVNWTARKTLIAWRGGSTHEKLAYFQYYLRYLKRILAGSSASLVTTSLS
jgi:hypothetical protein